MTAIPSLATARLKLRAMSVDDWPAYAQFLASGRSRYMGGPFATAVAWGMFCADYAQWGLFGCGALMVELRDSGVCVGQVGVNYGPLYPERELGWMLYPEAEGRGYAYEAAAALRGWARDVRRLDTLVSYVDPENLRSRKLAERLGATLDPTAARQDPTDLVFRHFGAAIDRGKP